MRGDLLNGPGGEARQVLSRHKLDDAAVCRAPSLALVFLPLRQGRAESVFARGRAAPFRPPGRYWIDALGDKPPGVRVPGACIPQRDAGPYAKPRHVALAVDGVGVPPAFRAVRVNLNV